MNIGFLADDKWFDNNLELVDNPTEHTRIVRILLDENGNLKYYQRKTVFLDDSKQQNLEEKPNACDDYVNENPYQFIAIVVGALSAVVFGASLYLSYPKIIKFMELNKKVSHIRNKLSLHTLHFNYLKEISVPKKVNKETIDKFIKRMGCIDESANTLKITTKDELGRFYKVVIEQVSNQLSEMSKQTVAIEEEAIKVFENIAYSPFTHLIPASSLSILGAIYSYEYFDDKDNSQDNL